MDAKPKGSTPRRPGVGTVVSALAVVAALSLLVVLWGPWSDDEVASNPDERPEPSASQGEPTGPDQSGGTRPTDDSELARVPTVVGMPVRQAVAEVERGFDDVRLVADANGAGETCVVFAQDPASGEHPSDTPVTLTYAGTRNECLG